jgi:hypothetical protein
MYVSKLQYDSMDRLAKPCTKGWLDDEVDERIQKHK